MTETLPAGLDIHIPQAFVEGQVLGDRWAGSRTWRYGDGELALWWAPGPSEALLLNNAIVMLETTHDPDDPPRVLDVDEVEWKGQPGFVFHERRAGPDGGPADVLVIQGADYWLYAWRVRAVGSQTILPLLHQVWETFSFAAE